MTGNLLPTPQRPKPHPRVGLVIAALGLLVSFWSICPWAQRDGDPTQAVYAGHVGDQRAQVLLLGLAVGAVGVAVYRLRNRWLLILAALLAFASLSLVRDVVDGVRAITEDDLEIASEVGWALYCIQFAALSVVVISVIGVVSQFRKYVREGR